MIFQKKVNTKKQFKKSAVISLITLLAFLLTFVSSFGGTVAKQDINEFDQKTVESGSPKSKRIIVKLNNETAAKAEAQITQKDMAIRKGSGKNMGDIFSKYKINKLEPMYKGLVSWKKKTGKTEKEYYNNIQKKFQKRSKRSKKGVSANTNLSNTYVIEADVNSQEEYDKLLESLNQDPRFEYAEASIEMSTCMIPNDPYFSSNGTWGKEYDDLYGVKLISCPEAWDTATGEGVTVAVVDTGIDNTHPDIAENIWTNTKEIANNGIDDDNNGYIDDIWGWNFVSSNNNPIDDEGHGTHVAGTIAATGNNGIGVVGVAPGAKVMAVKGLNKEGKGADFALVNAILYAADNGADVINCSFGGKGYVNVYEDAINYANGLGVVVVVAAGNDSDDVRNYSPAGVENAITVAATDSNDEKAYFTNWGSGVDVSAPGVDILSLNASGTTKGFKVGDKYTRLSGTSMAAPHVAGVAALITSCHPEFSSDQVSMVIQASTIDVNYPGFDYYTGYGRIDASQALKKNSCLDANIISPVQGSSAMDVVTVTGSAKGNNFLSYTLECAKVTEFSKEPIQWQVLEQSNSPVDKGQLGVFDTTELSSGKYLIRLSVKDSNDPQNTYFDRVEVEVEKTKITSPASLDPSYATEMKPGKVLPIQGFTIGQHFQNYRMEWGEGLNPTEWFTTGFTLENGGNEPVIDGLLANWDSSVYPGRAGFYQLRLLADYTSYSDDVRTFIYLEPDLAHDNWPQKLENNTPSSMLPVKNAAGQTSLVGLTSTTLRETALVKYSHDGILQYCSSHNYFTINQVAVGNIDGNPGEETVYAADGKIRILKDDNSYTEFTLDPQYKYISDYIALQDLDNDTIPEILVLGRDFASETRYLYAFKPDGSLLNNKFPIAIPNIDMSANLTNYNLSDVHYLIMDINNDGEKEIITQQHEEDSDASLKLYTWDGTPIEWQAVQPSFPNVTIFDMLGGDLDHDGQGEIVLCTKDTGSFDERKIYVIASDGSYKNGWPRTLPKKYVNSYNTDIAIADLDRDGTDEIIYSQLDEINVLKMDGMQLSDNWGIDSEYYYNNFVIGDINSDNYPEILAQRHIRKDYSIPGYVPRYYSEEELIALDKDAQIVKRWGILGAGGGKSSSSSFEPVLGDFDNNGKVDIAVCTSILNESNTSVDSTLYILTTEGDYNAENIDWPVRLHDPQNTSVHIPNKPLPDVTSIVLNTTSSSITVGQAVQLNATILPKGANSKVEWSIASESPSNVASVINGTVFAKHPGTAVIRAASAADPSKYAECTVTVTEAIDGVLLREGFENSSENNNLPIGWSVENVYTGIELGKWSIVSSGTTVDTPKSGSKMAKFQKVSYGYSDRLYRTGGFDLENSSYSLNFWMYHDSETTNYDSIQVQLSMDSGANWINAGEPIYRYSRSAGWKMHTISLNEYKNTSDIQIAFLGVGKGGRDIYLDDISVTDDSVVQVSGISLNRTATTLEAGQTEQLTATVAPENAKNKEVIWTVQSQSTSNVATVTSTGLVTGNIVGTAVIRVTSAADPSKYAECTVTVKPAVIPVTEISLNRTSMTLEAEQSEQLSATITPANATNKEVIWTVQSQSTSNVATVSSTGLVTGNNVGTAVIRATSVADSNKYAECTVTVKPTVIPVTGISLNKTTAFLEEGQSEQLSATITPANATNKEVIWTVQSQSTSNVATVSSTGLVTGNNVGTAVIRATSAADPSKYVECTVTVKPTEALVTNTLLSEGFEGTGGSIPTGWAIAENSAAKWIIVSSGTNPDPGAPKSGSMMAKFNSDSAPMYTYARLYTTSGLAIGSTGNYKLNFWMYHDTKYLGYTDRIQVQVTTGGGSNWNNVGSEINRNDGSTGWKMHTVDLDEFRNTADLRIAFLAYSGNGNDMYLDDISVTCTSAESIGISLNKTEMTLEEGQSEQLSATITPANATNKEVIWTVQSQSTSNVATVSSTGLVTGTNVGTAVIRATSASDPSKYVECTVTVKPVEVPVTSTLLSEGFEGTGGAIPEGWATNNTNAIWSVASIGTKPDPGAPKSGSMMAKFNSYDVSVDKNARLYTTTGLDLDNTGDYKVEFWMYHDTGNPNHTDRIQVQVSTDGGSSWSNVGSTIKRSDGSTGWKLHSVDLNQFRNIGDLRIAFLAISGCGNNMYLDDISVTCTSAEPIGVSLNKTEMTLEEGQSEELTAAITPANATNKEVIWTVQSQSTSNVATVSSTGLVTGTNVGTAVIRVTSAADPSKYAECTVTVKPAVIPVTEISLNRTTMTLEEGQSEQLSATITPTNATNKEVIWTVQSQSTSNVATVSSTGLVTGNNAGTAVIRATSVADPRKYVECTVTVKPAVIPVTGISLNKTTMTLEEGQSEELTAAITPANVTNKEVIWTVQSQSTSNVTTVSSTGLVTGNNAGTAVIRATSVADPSKYVECTVTVKSVEVPVDGTLLSEGFEGTDGSIPAGWVTTNTNAIWSVVSSGSKPDPGAPKSGSMMAKFNSYDAPGNTSSRLYTTLGLDMSNTGDYKVEFWMYHDTGNPNHTDRIQVQVSTNGGSNWSSVGSAIKRSDGSTGWKLHTVDLNQFRNTGDLQIAFLALSSNGNNMYLDDISVICTSTEPIGISLNQTTMTLEAGQNEQLIATITPDNTTNKEVIWTVESQSTSNVAIVSSTGLVTGTNVGTAVVRATSTADPNKFSECTVTVEAVEIPVDGVLLSEGFEDTDGSIPAGWEKTVNALAIWSVVSSATNPDPGAPNSGSRMAKFNSFDARMNTSSRLYTTSGIALGSTGDYKLDFWMYHDTEDTNYGDSIHVVVSTNGGNNWVFVGGSILRYDGSTGWKLHTVDLNQFRNTDDLRIGFIATSGNGNNMYLDDISVTCTSSDISVDSLYYGLSTQDEEQRGQVIESTVTEPVVTEPVVTESDVTEPVVTEPSVTEPTVSEPAGT